MRSSRRWGIEALATAARGVRESRSRGAARPWPRGRTGAFARAVPRPARRTRNIPLAAARADSSSLQERRERRRRHHRLDRRIGACRRRRNLHLCRRGHQNLRQAHPDPPRRRLCHGLCRQQRADGQGGRRRSSAARSSPRPAPAATSARPGFISNCARTASRSTRPSTSRRFSRPACRPELRARFERFQRLPAPFPGDCYDGTRAVIASGAKQSTISGSPRRFAPRDDDSVQTRRDV